jgi:hypothetical protein
VIHQLPLAKLEFSSRDRKQAGTSWPLRQGDAAGV